MVSAFLSATLLPGSSEAVLVGLLAAGQGQPAILVGAASFGNVAGAAANWLLGRFFSHYGNRAWFPVAPDTAAKTRLWFDRYGAWSLLFSWVPVIGDPLTLIAGLLRVSFWRFLLLVSVGKVLRYLAILSAWQEWPAS
ncbi:MAG: DedA family protein [Rhizobiaceae bacterium]|nr:DedA family protein [Rhizobiaceae bacterium]